MTHLISAVRGMNDILPPESHLWQHVEMIFRTTLQNHGYHEIRLPLLEKTELFNRSIGEATDIVEKEMYTFLDRNEESLTLRPEITAGCVRAGIEHGLFYHQIQRLWYLGPNFRYERPQKGRYRQFYQLGAEVFGLTGPDVDAEIILLTATLFKKLGLLSHVQLQINSLGSPASRATYRKHLVDYFTAHQNQLDEDSQRRLMINPLRILDSKNPSMQDLIANAPKLIDHLDTESAEHFATLKKYLTAAGIAFYVNPQLVRGLDYYTKTIFEWVTTELGAQGTVCAGGRYDGLVEQLGGNPTPALGFSAGIERIILLMQTIQKTIPAPVMQIYFMSASDDAFLRALHLSQQLREAIPDLSLTLHCGGGNLKNQFKKADKSEAQLALILGEQELQNNMIAIKFLREEKQQIEIPQDELVSFIKNSIL